MGIGRLLNRGRLAVPPNQRSFAWEEPHVSAFLQDIGQALDGGDEEYFLGTIVLIRSDVREPSILDGQQRLATAAILLSRIRNRLHQLGLTPSAQAVDRDYLRQHDLVSNREVPRLRLNVEDHDFFVERILYAPYDVAPTSLPSASEELRASNLKQQQAADVIDRFLDETLAGARQKDQSAALVRWVQFLADKARVIVVQVQDEVGAYRMFETLNDRGLRASQADILKNYFFGRAGPQHLQAAQMRWSSVSGAIETSGEDDESELLLTYLRHFWITKHGSTKEKELAASIKSKIANAQATMQFLKEADDAVGIYLALSLRSQTATELRPASRKHVHTIIHHLKVDQIRPLLFAIARRFSPQEQEKAFRLAVSWSARFLIVGGRGGMLDTQYSRRAEDVGSGRIKTAAQLKEAMKEYVPTDVAFEQGFATARVSRAHLARYYLRALDKTLKRDPAPEYVANEDETEINLEHVMPVQPSPEWQISTEIGQIAQKMLGNMVLLRATSNSSLGNKPFEEKKSVYKQSSYAITQPVAAYQRWTLDEIRQRQEAMAKIAVKTWPIN